MKIILEEGVLQQNLAQRCVSGHSRRSFLSFFLITILFLSKTNQIFKYPLLYIVTKLGKARLAR